MTRSTSFLAGVALLLAAASACAPKTAPPVATAPRYPSFMFPGVPAGLAQQPALVARHDGAWRFLQGGDLRAAEREFAWVTGELPTFFPSQVGLGYVSLARRDYREALERFELGLVFAPNYPSGLAGRGEALLGLGREAEALVNFDAAVAADPSLTELRARVESMRFRNQEDQVAAARKARDTGRLDEAATAYERALAASPESGFLYRELAAVEQRRGRLDAALAHARKALELDPSDVRAHLVAGEVFEAQRRFTAAVSEYEAAAAIEPGDDLATRIERARERAALAELPPEFQNIQQDPTITRAQLAALIGVRLDDLLLQATRPDAPVITDTRGSWAAPWIGAVVRAGVMDPYPNHTFQPGAYIRRSDLAMAVSRLLGMVGARSPRALEKWRAGRPAFGDLPATHLIYPAAAMAVGANVLMPLEGNTFQPGRAVSGAEALAALERIDALWREGRRR
jgi:tetratricopeptide (TPR) repeat protein